MQYATYYAVHNMPSVNTFKIDIILLKCIIFKNMIFFLLKIHKNNFSWHFRLF